MICDKEKCSGCYACYNICPKKCIKMIEDEFGYIYPYIDKTECLNCSMCRRVCPQLKDKIDFNHPLKSYAAYSKNDYTRCSLTSGAIATIIYSYIIGNGGVGYGLNNIKDEKFSFIRINNLDKIDLVKGSKYLHGYIEDSYKSVKKDLNDGLKVVFIGTACQIMGLKSFLNKDYDNLLTVDIICHGVTSQKFLKDELLLHNIDIKDVNHVSFRSIDGYVLSVTLNNNNKIDIPINKSYYYQNFMNGKIDRENCYNCSYAKRDRISDITIGDFWNLSEDANINISPEKGISLVLINTVKGEQYFNCIKENLIYEERPLDEAIYGNE